MHSVRGSRAFALETAKQSIPESRSGLWLQAHVLRGRGALPAPGLRVFAAVSRVRTRLHDSVQVPDYSLPAP